MTDHSVEEQTAFKAKPSKAETKSDITTKAAWAIIDDEVAKREAKTARLRQARIENEIKLAAEPKPVKVAAKKRVARKSSED